MVKYSFPNFSNDPKMKQLIDSIIYNFNRLDRLKQDKTPSQQNLLDSNNDLPI